MPSIVANFLSLVALIHGVWLLKYFGPFGGSSWPFGMNGPGGHPDRLRVGEWDLDDHALSSTCCAVRIIKPGSCDGALK
jgi:hypothetical protein